MSAPEAAALSRQFLETTGAGAIYESVLFRHREWQRRDVERAERELKGAKDKVSRALDGLG